MHYEFSFVLNTCTYNKFFFPENRHWTTWLQFSSRHDRPGRNDTRKWRVGRE